MRLHPCQIVFDPDVVKFHTHNNNNDAMGEGAWHRTPEDTPLLHENPESKFDVDLTPRLKEGLVILALVLAARMDRVGANEVLG